MTYISEVDLEQHRRGVEETQQQEQSYYLGFGPRADELSPDKIAQIAAAQGWSLPKKYKIYGVPYSLERDPIRSVKAMAIGRWLASRKHKSKKKSKSKSTKKKQATRTTKKPQARKKTTRKSR